MPGGPLSPGKPWDPLGPGITSPVSITIPGGP